MEWNRINIILTIICIPTVCIIIFLAIWCILAWLSPSWHFSWRCGRCWEFDRVTRPRNRSSYRRNEYSPAEAQAMRMMPTRRPAPQPAVVPGSSQTVEVQAVVENIEVKIVPQQKAETKQETGVLLEELKEENHDTM